MADEAEKHARLDRLRQPQSIWAKLCSMLIRPVKHGWQPPLSDESGEDHPPSGGSNVKPPNYPKRRKFRKP